MIPGSWFHHPSRQGLYLSLVKEGSLLKQPVRTIPVVDDAQSPFAVVGRGESSLQGVQLAPAEVGYHPSGASRSRVEGVKCLAQFFGRSVQPAVKVVSQPLSSLTPSSLLVAFCLRRDRLRNSLRRRSRPTSERGRGNSKLESRGCIGRSTLVSTPVLGIITVGFIWLPCRVGGRVAQSLRSRGSASFPGWQRDNLA